MTSDALRALPTTPGEIADLLERFDVAMNDARVEQQSAEGRYVDAYTAGLLLAKIVVRAAGYRIKGGENHRDTLLAVSLFMGNEAQASVDAIDAARKKRHATMYDAAGLVDETDVANLLERVATFETLVRDWLALGHPELLT